MQCSKDMRNLVMRIFSKIESIQSQKIAIKHLQMNGLSHRLGSANAISTVYCDPGLLI